MEETDTEHERQMPSPSEIERQDQENGAVQPEPTLTERFLDAKAREASTQVEIAHLERTLAAKRTQLREQEAASAALLRELGGGGPAKLVEEALRKVKITPIRGYPPNFGSGARQAG